MEQKPGKGAQGRPSPKNIDNFNIYMEHMLVCFVRFFVTLDILQKVRRHVRPSEQTWGNSVLC